MSELIQKHDNRATIRWKLLTGVSALALMAYVSSGSIAQADDSDRPTVWIELGGQLEQMDDAEQSFAPPFVLATPRPKPQTISPLSLEGPPLYSISGEGKISFQPEDSDWMLSASLLYGRSGKAKHVHQQSYPAYKEVLFTSYGLGGTYTKNKYFDGAQFMDTRVKSSESHAVLDFQAGKDVGLGMFGSKGSSVFSFGVRFAQFASNTNIALRSDPNFKAKYFSGGPIKLPIAGPYDSNAATLIAERNFHGVGPSISWSASAPVAGNSQSAQIALDWGVNVSLLFGRQKANIHHQSTAVHHGGGFAGYRTTVYQPPVQDTRTRSVTVPNIGGFAGMSFLYSNAKISFGYRADMFFGAIDGGIDARKSENRGFFGPFASVSVGLGD